MPDIEKVIKGLEQCKEGGSCDGCQFDIQSSKCIFLLHEDALALLNEQHERIAELQTDIDSLKKSCGELYPMVFDVVRCKDCKYGVLTSYGSMLCYKNVKIDQYKNPDWFCADGERRSENA